MIYKATLENIKFALRALEQGEIIIYPTNTIYGFGVDATNSDAIAKHFYEQGKADAIKESVAKGKNVNMDPRQELTNNIDAGGVKVRVLGESSSDFKFKIKNNK